MKKVFRKNHIIITALALLIAVAGYINYSDAIKKDKNKNTNEVNGEIYNNDNEPDDDSITDPGVAVFTSTNVSEVIISAKLEREQIRATSKETLLEIINNENIAEEGKADAIAQMVEITEASEKEVAAELLLEAKGFSNVIVSITDNQVDVVVEISELLDGDLAQIEDVVTRKTGCSVDNLTITSVSPEADSEAVEPEITEDVSDLENETESDSKMQ